MINNSTTKKALAAIGIVLATAIWGSSFSVIKNALTSITPLWFVSMRFSIAIVLLAIICAKRFKHFNKTLLKQGVIIGIPLSISYIFQNLGLMNTTASNTAFITSTYVVIIPFIMWLVYRKIRPANFVIALVTLGGLALLSLNESFHIASGDFITLGCSLMLAIHMVVLGRFSNNHDTFLLTFIQIVMVAAVNTVLALIIEPLPVLSQLPTEVFLSMGYCAVLPTIVCYLIQTWAQKILSPISASVLMMGESIFGAFFGWLLLKEVFTASQFVGAAILIVCMVCAVLLDYFPRRSAGTAAEESPDDHPAA